MTVSRDREKLINAILYFSSHTTMCGKTKLFKLLFILDTEHFKQTGRSVTGLDYYALRMGPVPTDLQEEWLNWEDDMARALKVELEDVGSPRPLEKVIPLQQFDASQFSRRELELLEQTAARYRTTTAKDLISLLHRPNGAWKAVYKEGEGKCQLIPFELSADGPQREHVLSIAAERQELLAALSAR